jgi:hypothetical protein
MVSAFPQNTFTLLTGYFNTDIVDGFTYADRDYYFSGIRVTRGQWTKFADNQSVRCVSKGGVPRCCLTTDPDSYGCCWGVAPGPNGIVC